MLSLSSGRTSLQRSLSGLCMLVLELRNGDYKPVGRSYSGEDWEPSAGKFSDLKYRCSSDSCVVRLPRLGAREKYHLVHLDESQLSADDQIARFLEQATFGVTWSDIKSMMGDSTLASFAQWMKTQIDSSITEATLHREYFRRRLNSRFDWPSVMSLVTQPCQKGAGYRLYTFTRKDEGRDVKLETQNGKRLVKVDGQLRTIVSSVASGGEEMPDGIFGLCRFNERCTIY